MNPFIECKAIVDSTSSSTLREPQTNCKDSQCPLSKAEDVLVNVFPSESEGAGGVRSMAGGGVTGGGGRDFGGRQELLMFNMFHSAM